MHQWSRLGKSIWSDALIDWCRVCGVVRLTPSDSREEPRYLVPGRDMLGAAAYTEPGCSEPTPIEQTAALRRRGE